MYLLSWLRSLRFTRTTRSTRRRCFPSRPARPRCVLPRLEVLEDRTVPSTVTWVGGASGDWDTASNWSTGALPGAKDDVVISTASATITHSLGYNETIHSLSMLSSDTLSWSAGSLNLAGGSTLAGTVNLSGGTWTVGGNLTLSGTLNWNGNSTMNGSGTTTLNSGATMSLGGDNNGDQQTLDGRTFNNQGTTNWLAGSYIFNLNDGAVFNNSGTFNANATPWSGTQYFYDNVGASGTFNNTGTFNNAPGSGSTTEAYFTLFNNKGTVNANTGALYLQGGGNDSSGTFFVPTAGELAFAGVTTLKSSIGTSSNLAAGTVAFSGGTTTVAGVINDTTGFTVAINSGTADFDNASDSIPILNLSSGTLSGSAAVTVTNTLTWNGNSTMNGSGTTTLNSGATTGSTPQKPPELLEGS